MLEQCERTESMRRLLYVVLLSNGFNGEAFNLVLFSPSFRSNNACTELAGIPRLTLPPVSNLTEEQIAIIRHITLPFFIYY